MNNKGQNLLAQVIIFLVLWLITSLIWSIWLDGIYIPIAGLITSLAAIGAFNIVIHVKP